MGRYLYGSVAGRVAGKETAMTTSSMEAVIYRNDNMPVPFATSQILTLAVSDPEVLCELGKHPEGLARERFALGALRLGVIALRQASGELDSAAVRQAGQEILRDLGELLSLRGGEITAGIASALRQYFDPTTGTLPQRIESLIRNDGDLERALHSHLAPENSTISRALAAHLGEGSALFKLLSPDDAQGFKARIESMLKEVTADHERRVAKEFSLDAEDSALSRLVRRIRESNGSLADDVKSQVNCLIGEFSLDKPDSALSRLVREVEDAQNLIDRNLTLDDENSPLSRLKKELLATINSLVKTNVDFHAEVREALAKMQSHKETAAKSTLHGNTFEEQLGDVLDAEAHRLNDVCESTGATVGAIAYCKVGDFVTTLGPDSAAPGGRVVWEAKSDASYDLAGALKEIEQARKNRQSQVGVFVFERSTSPTGLEPFARYGCNLVIVWDPDDSSSELYVRVAFSLARALVVRENQESTESEKALEVIEISARTIEKQIENLDQIKTWAETVKNNGEKIADRAARMRGSLTEEVEELDRQLAALKTSMVQA